MRSGLISTLFDFIAGKADVIDLALAIFSVLAIVLLCLPFHECAHAAMAHWLGDDTAMNCGRLTMNPLAHIDPMGALCMCVCSIGWAKPTPVNLSRCRKTSVRTADILVSMAGPLSNVILAFVFIIASKILAAANGIVIASNSSVLTPPGAETAGYIVIALWWIASINAYLAVFNLLPVPPFDGYSLIQGILPRKAAIWVESHAQMINLVVFILLIAGMLGGPLSFLSDKIIWLLDKATGFIKV